MQQIEGNRLCPWTARRGHPLRAGHDGDTWAHHAQPTPRSIVRSAAGSARVHSFLAEVDAELVVLEHRARDLLGPADKTGGIARDHPLTRCCGAAIFGRTPEGVPHLDFRCLPAGGRGVLRE